MGFLKERTTFLISSFALRLIGGVGDAGFYPSAYAIFAVEFPDLVSTSIVSRNVLIKENIFV